VTWDDRRVGHAVDTTQAGLGMGPAMPAGVGVGTSAWVEQRERDRRRGERVLVEHASHCKASSGHAKTYYCWHDLTSGLTDFPAIARPVLAPATPMVAGSDARGRRRRALPPVSRRQHTGHCRRYRPTPSWHLPSTPGSRPCQQSRPRRDGSFSSHIRLSSTG